jgi:transposase
MELRMSRKQRDRLKVLEQLKQRQISQRQAAQWLGLSARQVRRLERRYAAQGDCGLMHRGRGKPSNRRIGAEREAQAKQWLKAVYHDFGPTLAAEKLEERQGIVVSRETVRGWMRQLGLWSARRKSRPHRRRRPRRACFGELVQLDTSAHDWLEGRGPALMLLTMIDDATGIKLSRFAPADTSLANMEIVKCWIERYGRPLTLYTDWASHFKQTLCAGEQATPTQIERALGELDIQLICAHSPQAKGRVERSHGIDQDRLIKELRLAGICTLEGANGFLEQHYLPTNNARFGIQPADAADAHRPVDGLPLDSILSIQDQRCVARDLTVQVDGLTWQLEPEPGLRGLASQRVTVERRIDGSMHLRWGARWLHYRAAPLRSGAVHALHKSEAQTEEPNNNRPKILSPSGGSSGLRPSSPPEGAYPKSRGIHIPPKDHPWKKRTLLLGR